MAAFFLSIGGFIHRHLIDANCFIGYSIGKVGPKVWMAFMTLPMFALIFCHLLPDSPSLYPYIEYPAGGIWCLGTIFIYTVLMIQREDRINAGIEARIHPVDNARKWVR